MLGVVGIPVGTMSGILASLILVKVVNALSAGWLNFALSFHTSLPALILAVILSIATIYFLQQAVQEGPQRSHRLKQ